MQRGERGAQKRDPGLIFLGTNIHPWRDLRRARSARRLIKEEQWRSRWILSELPDWLSTIN